VKRKIYSKQKAPPHPPKKKFVAHDLQTAIDSHGEVRLVLGTVKNTAVRCGRFAIFWQKNIFLQVSGHFGMHFIASEL
jgi:hypothetical protein